MAKSINLRDEKTRLEVGLSVHRADTVPDTVSERYRQKKRQPTQQKRDRVGTINAILDAVYQSDRPLSRLEIARAIGREKTPHLVAIIESLVETNVLVRIGTVSAWGIDMYTYAKPDGAV